MQLRLFVERVPRSASFSALWLAIFLFKLDLEIGDLDAGLCQLARQGLNLLDKLIDLSFVQLPLLDGGNMQFLLLRRSRH